MKKIAFMFFMPIFITFAQAHDKIINVIPYNQYNFGSNNLKGSLTILGWSRDNKILYEWSACNVTDAELLSNYGAGNFKYY
jgi:hypothetical protein